MPEKIDALYELAKASLQPTHGDALVTAFVEISGQQPVCGGGSPADTIQLAAAAGSFTGIVPVFPLQMQKSFAIDNAQSNVVVNVEQGKPITIEAGLSSRVRTWGMATAVARLDHAAVKEVVVEALSGGAQQPTIIPGGLWIIPADGSGTAGILPLAAYAYPTRSGDPTIDRVEFSAWWPARGPKTAPWQVLCTAKNPIGGDIFECDADLSKLGVPPGHISVSFDVYDRAGHRNLAPNGVRTITWSPTPQAQVATTPTNPNIIEPTCGEQGASCAGDADCCAGACTNGTCGPSSSSSSSGPSSHSGICTVGPAVSVPSSV